MVVVTAAASASAASNHHHVHRGMTLHSHESWIAHQRSNSTSGWASETTIDNIRPCPSRSNSRWFLDDLKLRLSDSELKPTKPQHWLVDATWFNAAVSAIVVMNTLQIGVSVDVRHGHWESLWRYMDIMFAILFGLEMSVKIIAMRFEYFKEAWNLLDFFLAWLAIIEVIVVAISDGNAGMAGKLTMLRILRLFRLLRILRLFHMFRELVILMEVMVESLRTLAWLLVLIGLVLYVTAILCVELVGTDSTYPSYSKEGSDLQASTVGFNNFQYFGTVIRSMYSLWSLVTLSEWSTITRPVSEHQPVILIVLVAFTMLTTYGVMNVLVGVMVEHALKANADLEALKDSRHKEDQMEMILTVASKISSHAAHVSGNPDITKDSFRDAISSSNTVADMLTRIDLPSNCSMRELFLLIDDNGDGIISQDEFETGLYRLLYCGEFQRSCIMQISLNTLKQGLATVQADLEAMRTENRERCSAESSQGQVQPDQNGCVHANMQEQNSKAEITGMAAVADELHRLRSELQEMRLELGARIAEVGPRGQLPQATKQMAAPEMPRMGSVQIEMDEVTADHAAMPAVVPGLPLRPPSGFTDGGQGAADVARASKAATLLRQLDDLVGGLRQHNCEHEGGTLVRLHCADLISQLAQALATGGRTASGSSNSSQLLEEQKDQDDMRLNTWDTPQGGPPVQSVWAMESCCGKNRRPQPVRRL